jgi:hypothetical protein
MDHRERRALKLLRLVPLASQAAPVDVEREQQRWRYGERDQPEAPVDPRRHIQHPDDREQGREEGDHSRDRERLERLCVVLDAVGRVGDSAHVVVRERQPLHVAKQARTKAQEQLLAGVRTQDHGGELDQLVEEHDQHQQNDGHDEDLRARVRHRTRQEGIEHARQRVRPDHAVHRDLERDWDQKGGEAREHAQHHQASDMKGERTCFRSEPAVDVLRLRRAHRIFGLRRLARPIGVAASSASSTASAMMPATIADSITSQAAIATDEPASAPAANKA